MIIDFFSFSFFSFSSFFFFIFSSSFLTHFSPLCYFFIYLLILLKFCPLLLRSLCLLFIYVLLF